MCLLRDDQPADYDACLRVFASHVPWFFGAEEQADYARFLTRPPCPYLVAEAAGRVVGGGGFYLRPDEGRAGLAWGIPAGGKAPAWER